MKTEAIPEGWEEEKLSKLILENPKSKIQVQKVNNYDKYLFFTSGEKILRYYDWLIDGENIFMATGGVANVQYNEGKCAYSTDTYCFKSKINAKLTYYNLLNLIFKINYSYFQGTGLKHLQKPLFKKYKLLYPKLKEEQDKISKILDTIDLDIKKQLKL